MSVKKSIMPLDAIDLGGIQPRAEELVTEEVIGYLNNININSSLLSDDDPLKDEYTKFLNDLGNSPIIITNEDIDIGDESSYFDDLDLSNKKTIESEKLEIGLDYFISNRLWANSIFGSTIFPNTSISPFEMEKRSIKMMNETHQFVNVGFDYEPQILAQKTDLIRSK